MGGKKKGIIITIILIVLAIPAIILTVVWYKFSQTGTNSLPEEILGQLTSADKLSGGKVTLKLYLESAQTGELGEQEQEFTVFSKASSSKQTEPPQLPELARIALDALSSDPPSDKWLATLPKGARMRDIYLDAAGTAYVDFDEQLVQRHPGGTQAELITIYSVVDTLCANFPSIKQVKFLIGGREAQTLAGHVDIRYPFSYRKG